MFTVRPARFFIAAALMWSMLYASPFICVSRAQNKTERELQPDIRRALSSRVRFATAEDQATTSARKSSSIASEGAQMHAAFEMRPRGLAASNENSSSRRTPARVAAVTALESAPSAFSRATPISAGTSMTRVLHTSQLSITSSAGTIEQYVDRTDDLIADERTTFDARGGAFDIAVGRSGARYEVYSAINNNGTPNNPSDDYTVGVLVSALDSNGDYASDSSTTFDLERSLHLPSAVAVVSGTSKAGKEFVIVSSSGFYNRNNPKDPDNEPSAGVALLVRDPLTNGFDSARSRELVRVGNNQLNNANALTLLPNNDLLIADFDSNNLRIVRDTDGDGIPDTLDPTPFYTYRYADDAPIDIAANTRGIVFSHSFGNSSVLLALYDDNHDGRADREAVVVEKLSLDNNLFLHGLTTDRDGTVYIIEDASGAADTIADGGNGGTPRISAFPDPSLDGFLSDGAIYAIADDATAQALSGLAFGVDAAQPPTFNPIDATRFFVVQHYLDFLDRAPEKGGLEYWSAQLAGCNATDLRCQNSRRISVSSAFFIEQEFQQTGSFVYRMYKGSLNRRPSFAEFNTDRSQVIGGAGLAASKQAFANAWVQRTEFLQKYPQSLSTEQLVDALLKNVRDAAGVDLSAQRADYLNTMQQSGRGSLVRQIIEEQAFQQAEYNRAFVLMQYFGYLRRDPDESGYQFWLDVLNNRVANNYRGMVCAFITSAEYQKRFGSLITHNDTQCGQP